MAKEDRFDLEPKPWALKLSAILSEGLLSAKGFLKKLLITVHKIAVQIIEVLLPDWH